MGYIDYLGIGGIYDTVYDVERLDALDSIRKNVLANESNETLQTELPSFSDIIYVPNWSIEDFVKDRLKYRTQGMDGTDVSMFSDPGNYFYKIFFNFNTGYGLLGSVIKTANGGYTKEDNTAWQYLANNVESPRFTESYRKVLKNKQASLEKFIKLLNYLTTECPWFFKEVHGLENTNLYDFSNIVSLENREIEIAFNQDAVDMRVSLLLDLYKDACYDYKNFREIIPENLRKFDMSIIIFNPPTTGMNIIGLPNINYSNISIENNSSIKYCKTTTDLENEKYTLTFKCLNLKNCEIDVKSLNTMPSTLSNETGFKNEMTMKIKFERSYVYNINRELNIKLFDNQI